MSVQWGQSCNLIKLGAWGKPKSISKVMGGQDCSELGVMALAKDSDLKTPLMGGRLILSRLRIRGTMFHKSTEASRLGTQSQIQMA